MQFSSNTKVQSECNDIIHDIISQVENHYDFIKHSKLIHESSKQLRQVTHQTLVSQMIRRIELQNEYVQKPTSLYHINVYKQFVPNLCGYHATFNLISAIQFIKHSIEQNNAAAFWSYVKRTQDFLKQYRITNLLDQSIPPWTDDDIKNGDFERSYLIACLESKPLFKSTFKDEVIENVKYQISCDVVFLQYQIIFNTQEEIIELQKKFDEFIAFSPDPGHELIQGYMLGITSHWISFLAHKSIRGVQFIVMDSRNRDYLTWTEQEMKTFITEENENRLKRGQKAWTNFSQSLHIQCMKDIQLINTLIVSWLTGQTRIEDYHNVSRINQFMDPLNNDLAQWAESYKHTILDYMKYPAKNLPERIKQKISNIAAQLEQLKEQTFTIIQVKNLLMSLVDYSNLFTNLNITSIQTQVYFTDSEIYEQQSEIIDLKAMYVFEYATKLSHFIIRIQFKDNIFHPQGGGQPDDHGILIINNREYKIHNLFNDRSRIQVFVDLLYDLELYNLLKEQFIHRKSITQVIDRQRRIYLTRLQSAGHYLQYLIQKNNPKSTLKDWEHFVGDSYLQYDKDDNLEISDVIDLSNTDYQVKIDYLTIDQLKQRISQVPEFVLQKHNIRFVQMADDDPGFPCYGTHVKNVKKDIVLIKTKMQRNKDGLFVYYEI